MDQVDYSKLTPGKPRWYPTLRMYYVQKGYRL